MSNKKEGSGLDKTSTSQELQRRWKIMNKIHYVESLRVRGNMMGKWVELKIRSRIDVVDGKE